MDCDSFGLDVALPRSPSAVASAVPAEREAAWWGMSGSPAETAGATECDDGIRRWFVA